MISFWPVASEDKKISEHPKGRGLLINLIIGRLRKIIWNKI